jgi:hypothetical protein
MGTAFGRASASEIDEASVSDYFSGLLGYHVDHALTTFSPSHSAVVVVLRSLQSNELLGGMYHALKDAAKYQLTASRPGMVFMQLRNLTSTQLRELVKQQSEPPLPNGLRVVTTRLFRGDARNHVHTVAYVAPGNFVRHQSLIEDRDGRRVETQITEDAVGYFFVNERNREFADVRYRLFEESEAIA